MDELFNLDKYKEAIRRTSMTMDSGKVSEVTGLIIRGFLPGASIGSLVQITPSTGHDAFFAEVIGVRQREVVMMPLMEMQGIGLGARIDLIKQTATIRVGKNLLGRVLNGLGQPIDGKGDLRSLIDADLYPSSKNPLDRSHIDQPLDLGVRAINGCLTIGRGQRVGILAGSGVGKSVLLGMMAKQSRADVNVIALIGERGREVKDFIDYELGPEGLARSVIIVATGDDSALIRKRAAYVAAAVADYFSGQNKEVLLMMDSLTRFSMAQREISLSAGEPPATKGYTPSVFSTLPKLLERSGRFTSGGSITGLYTVLVEGDDMDDPIADSVRSIVDGHIVLSRKLAQAGHFPAIDILQSNSRVMNACVSDTHRKAALALRQLLATYKESEDLINIGAYQKGSNPKIDQAINYHEHILQFLKQDTKDVSSFAEAKSLMLSMFGLQGE